MRIDTISPPAVEPVLLDEVKDFLRLTSDHHDALIGALITTARQACEHHTGLRLIDQTVEIHLDRFECGDLTLLPVGPAHTRLSLELVDEDGLSVPADTVGFRPGRYPALINRRGWPSLLSDIDGIRVTVIAGFGADHNQVPQVLRTGIMMLVKYLYDNPDLVNVGNIVNEMPIGLRYLWAPEARVVF